MLTELGFMWDGHVGRITTAKHRAGLVDLTTSPMPSAPYHCGPKAHEFEKTRITRMLENNIIEPAQTE